MWVQSKRFNWNFFSLFKVLLRIVLKETLKQLVQRHLCVPVAMLTQSFLFSTHIALLFSLTHSSGCRFPVQESYIVVTVFVTDHLKMCAGPVQHFKCTTLHV